VNSFTTIAAVSQIKTQMPPNTSLLLGLFTLKKKKNTILFKNK